MEIFSTENAPFMLLSIVFAMTLAWVPLVSRLMVGVFLTRQSSPHSSDIKTHERDQQETWILVLLSVVSLGLLLLILMVRIITKAFLHPLPVGFALTVDFAVLALMVLSPLFHLNLVFEADIQQQRDKWPRVTTGPVSRAPSSDALQSVDAKRKGDLT